MATAIGAGPYVRHVARATNGQPTTVLYQSQTYSGPDARESARHGMNVAGITGKPVRLVAFAWGEDSVDVAAIQNGAMPINPYADLYSIRAGKLVRPADFCSRELEQLVRELNLVARRITGMRSSGTYLFSKETLSARNSNGVPLLVECMGSFPYGTVNITDYPRKITTGLGDETALAIVFTYGTDSREKRRPAADILAFPKAQPTPENPEASLCTVDGYKPWQPAGICRAELDLATRLRLNPIRRGFQRGADMHRLVERLADG